MNEAMRVAIHECAARKSAHVVDALLRGTRSLPIVEVFIDSEQGVTSDLCSAVSRDVAEAIDRSAWLEGSYRLEVSSPGIDRALKFPWQYRKHVGRILTVTLREDGGGGKKTGTLVSADEACIVLQSGKEKLTETISFDAIVEAVVKPPW